MAITLRIDNFDQLPDGGPVEYTAGARGFDIGRGQHLDWCLPDDSRFISTTHCEIRFENGAYWLRDVSKNGTYVNGADGRVQSPYRLANGDRLKIGQYFVSVAITGAGAVESAPAPQPANSFAPAPDGDLWGVGNATPQPVDRRWFANEQRNVQRAPDVLDHFIDMPAVRTPSASPFGAPGPASGGVPGAPQFPAAQPFPPAAPAWQQQPPAQPAGFPQPAPQFGGSPAPGTPFAPAPGPYTQAPAPGPYTQAPGFNPAPSPFTQPPAPFATPTPQFGGGQDGSATAFITALATAAGISPQAFAGRSPDDVAAEVGAILRVVTEQLAGLLRARAAAKLMAKSGNRTMITSQNNNPLKFIPDVREALEVMFARNRSGYLTAAQSFKEGFENIKSHEVATYAAMQKALARIAEDLTPDYIEDKVGNSAFGSKKARAWDLYVERWNAKTEPYENGILDLFLTYFAEAYDASNKS